MDEAERSELPWDALLGTEGDIPWDVLRRFADALTEDPSLLDDLQEVYEEAWWKAEHEETYADSYVTAILSLAAPRLKGESARAAVRFLMEKLTEACEEDADIAAEVLTASCGAFEDVALQETLDALDDLDADREDWTYLWSLAAMAAQSEDEDLRRRVVELGLKALERTENGLLHPWTVVPVGWTLACLGCEEAVPLLRRVAAMAPGLLGGGGDLEESADQIEGKLDYEPLRELWEEPVGEWLPGRVREVREWYREQKERAKRASAEPVPEPARHPVQPVASTRPKIGRNEPCPCGSGKKYKRCCGNPASR